MSKTPDSLSLQERWDAALHAERWDAPSDTYPDRPPYVKMRNAYAYYAPGKRGLLRFAARQVMLINNKPSGFTLRQETQAHREGLTDDAQARFFDSAKWYVGLYAGQNPYGWQSPRLYASRATHHDYTATAADADIHFNPGQATASITNEDGTYNLSQFNYLTTEHGERTQYERDLTTPDGVVMSVRNMPPLIGTYHLGQIRDVLSGVDIGATIQTQHLAVRS